MKKDLAGKNTLVISRYTINISRSGKNIKQVTKCHYMLISIILNNNYNRGSNISQRNTLRDRKKKKKEKSSSVGAK